MYRFGVLGVGGSAKHYLAAAAQHPSIEVVHIADPDESQALALAERFGVPGASRKLGAVASNRGIDAVIIDLPLYERKTWILRAVRAQKDVLCVAPLCRTYKEAREVLSTADKCAAEVVAGVARRYSPTRIKAREIILSGELGRPVLWTVSAMGVCDSSDEWLWDHRRGGGRIVNDSIHDFDFACWVLGPPVEVYAQSHVCSSYASSSTQAAAVVRFAAGDSLLYGAAWQEADLGAPPGPHAVIGPLGTLVFETDDALRWHRSDGQVLRIEVKKSDLAPGGLGESWVFYKQLEDFVTSIRTANPSTAHCTAAQALAGTFVADTIAEAGPDGALVQYRGPRR